MPHRHPKAIFRRFRLNRLMKIFGGRCAYCRRPVKRNPIPAEEGLKATIDHDIPLARDGADDNANIVLACYRCNRAKGTSTGEEFRPGFREKLLTQQTSPVIGDDMNNALNHRQQPQPNN